MGIRSIARQLGLARETVRRFYYASSVDELLGAPWAGWPTMLDAFAVHLHKRFGRLMHLRCCTLRRTSSIGISRQLQRGPRLLETASFHRRCAGRKADTEGPADYLMDATTPKTASPMTGRSGGGRFLPAVHPSRPPQGMSRRLRRCSPNALGNN